MEKNQARLFFGLSVKTIWPEKLPSEKVLLENDRHITLVFLGNISRNDIQNVTSCVPKITKESFVGKFDKVIFLPEKQPRVVAWHATIFEKDNLLKEFQKELLKNLQNKGFAKDLKNNFLPHLTLCRNHFDIEKWNNDFKVLPIYIDAIHLYESLGNSKYKSLWKKDFLIPFNEIEHTADLAFHVHGKSIDELKLNAFIALCFECPDLLDYYKDLKKVDKIEDVIILLNDLFAKAEIDGKHIPFKAVSFNANVIEKDNLLVWEMIVDV